MTRGTTLFICTQCKKVFLAPDIEYGAMAFSVPMPCERCGSIRTLPMKFDFFVDSINPDKPLERQLRDYAVYKDIWGKQGSNSNSASGWSIWMTAFMVLMSLFIG